MLYQELAIPTHYVPGRVSEIYRVPYLTRSIDAKAWAKKFHIQPALLDTLKIGLLIIDAQNTFCLSDSELFVSGRSGNGAIDDNRRLCEFIYRNLGLFTRIIATMDTHLGFQIFHPGFWIDKENRNPDPMTIIALDDIESGRWRVNTEMALGFENKSGCDLTEYALHYVSKLASGKKFPLIIWPYHAMLGGIGHALVSSVEEAIFFHSVARNSQTAFEMKGSNPFTENYSVLRPEVTCDEMGIPFAGLDTGIVSRLMNFDRLIIAGQAKSHCVSWTVSDILREIRQRDPLLARRVYLLDDCSSPVVVPGIDFTEQTEATWQGFSEAGMHRVLSTDPIYKWPEFI
ncbi:MAG: isochorismatase [Candidatus Riflebacteria bacterium]|nr:isochorismatase [Candidatus Riflebacteria bacterium]